MNDTASIGFARKMDENRIWWTKQAKTFNRRDSSWLLVPIAEGTFLRYFAKITEECLRVKIASSVRHGVVGIFFHTHPRMIMEGNVKRLSIRFSIPVLHKICEICQHRQETLWDTWQELEICRWC